MGGGGKGGSSVSSVQIPPEVLARYNAVNERAETVAQQPYQAYSKDPNAFVAPLTETQQAGIQNTNAMAGAAQPYYAAATEQLMQAQQGAQPAMRSAYQNVGQAQDVGQQYANIANQYYGQAQGAASPYYGAATQGTQAALQGAQPYQAAGTGAIAGASAASQPYYNAATLGYGQALGAAAPLQDAAQSAYAGAAALSQPYYGAATQGTQAALQGAQPYQQAATQGVGAALQGGQAYQPAATAAALQGGQAVNAAPLDVQQFMSPYTKNVVEATQRGLQQQFGQQLSQQQADAIKSGAFGGDRSGMQRALLQGQQSLAEAQALSPLYQQAYNNALQTAQQQQGVGLGAAQANRAAQAQLGQQLAGLGQQNYAQQLGAAQQMGALGQQGFGQQLSAAQQMQNLGGAMFGQGMQGGQAMQGLAQQKYGQEAGVAQGLAGLGQNMYQQGIGTGQALLGAGQQGYGQQMGAAQQMQNLGKDVYGQNLQTGQAVQGLGQQQFGQGTGIAQILSGLAQQGYGMGAGTSQALGNLGAGAQQAGLAGAQAQMGAGATEQQTQQAGLQAMYNQFMQERGYPFQIAQFLSNIATGTGALSGNTTTTTMASDRRLKENVQKVGETHDGQPIYRYNFKGDPRTQIGLMAQEVEKDHPEAVDDSRGYKRVDYKKATEDAIHKDNGGEVSGLERYSMSSPSTMLQKSGGLGALTLPQMRTGSDIAIKPGVNAAEIDAMRAPTATGLSPGSLESAKAQYASMSSITPQSGEDYGAYKMQQLKDFLAKYGETPPATGVSSQGGLVPPGGGEGFAAGGYAAGGYMNPALQFYGAQGAKGGFDAAGPYGATLTPMQARQLLQGTKPPEDRRPTGIQQAKDIGSLGSMAAGAWKDRPDFMRSDEDVARRGLAAKISEAELAKKAKELGIDYAHGGMADGRHHYANTGYVNPGAGIYGTGEDNSLGSIIAAPIEQHELLKPNERRQMPQPKGGLGTALDVAKTGKDLYSAGKTAKGALDWMGSKLGADAAAAAVPEALAGEAAGAAAAEGLGAAAAEGLGTAAAEGLGAAAVEGLGAAAAGASAALPVVAPLMLAGKIFGWFNEGGAVPRRHFAGDEGSFVTPPRADRLTGPDTGEAMSEEDQAALKKLALQTIVQQSAAKSPAPKPVAEVPAEVPAKPAARPAVGETGAGRSPFKYFASDLMSDTMKPETKAALSSENLWVPALAGLGTVLASRAPTRGQAIGEGLVGATTAYTGLQKQQSATDLARAQERETLGKAAKGSVEYNAQGFPTAVFVSDGYGGMRRIPFIEAYRNRDKLNLLPETLAEIEGIAKSRPEIVKGAQEAAGQPDAKKEPPPAAGSKPPAAPIAPTASTKGKATTAAAPEAEEPQQAGAIITSNEGGNYRYSIEPKKNGAADSYFANTGAFKGVNLQDPMEVQSIIQSNQNLFDRAKKDEEIAENIRKQIPTIDRNMADLWTLSSSINKIGDKGLTQRGAGQEGRAAMVNLYNTAARVMGVPNMQNIDANSDISNTEIIRKIQNLSSPEIAKGAGFHAAGIAESIRDAMPSGNLTVDAANTILASMYVEMQKMRDFNKYYDAQTRKYGTGLNAYGNFNDDMSGVYANEKEAIRKALLAHDVVPKSGQKYRQSYADVMRKDPRAAAQLDKMFKTPGFARYWSNN